jgi:hypothetical protein
MYAYILETGRGFFEGVCTPSNKAAHLRAPPSALFRELSLRDAPQLPQWSWVMQDHRKGLSRNPFKALRYISPLVDTTTPTSASL